VGLTITLLGDVTIRRTGGESETAERLDSSPQVRMAFAMLTLGRHQGVTRDALAEALWPEGLPPTWRSSLRTVVSRVRAFAARVLGDDGDLLVMRDGTYLLHLSGDTTVDLEVAESQVTMAAEALSQGQAASAHGVALQATDRLRAPFLPEHHGDWIEARRAHQTQMLLVGLELVSEAASALGDHAGALAAAAEAIDRAPLRESSHRCLMAAHVAAGNRAEAVHAYQRLRRMLAEELGVNPHEETEIAYIELLGPAEPASYAGRSGRTVPQPESAPFVGRDSAMADAGAAWDHVLATTTSRLVLVTGEAGIGKTRFATEFAKSRAPNRPMVLFGRCDPDAMIPYQPFVETLDALVAVTFHERAAALSSPACAELAGVFPSFAGSAPAPRSGNRSVLFDAVTTAVKATALDHPLLIVLDDCQWADGDSSLLLRHLLRNAHATRLLVMAIVGSNPRADHPFGETVRALSRDGRVTHLRLGGLDEAACRTLVREMRPEAPDLLAAAPRLVADTSGNPFLLIESIRVHEDQPDDDREADDLAVSKTPGAISPELDTFVTRRLETLGRSSQTLLAAAAVAGSYFELEVVAEATGLDEADALDALEGALASGLVVDVSSDDLGRSYRFTHDVVRRALYHRLSGARRRQLHERVADAIEDARGSAAVTHVLQMAHHRCTAAEPHGDVRTVTTSPSGPSSTSRPSGVSSPRATTRCRGVGPCACAPRVWPGPTPG
jgi:DNA-binding SARP family transcriptional activator